MKVSLVALIAALASSAVAIPLSASGLAASGLSTTGLPEIATADQLVALLKQGTYGHGHSITEDKGLLGDVGVSLNGLLTVTGDHGQVLLIKLSPSVAKLLVDLGLPGLGISVGSIVMKASTVGELVADVGTPVENLLTVVGKDVGCLLIKLSDPVARLLAGLSLGGIGEPVGEVIATLGGALVGSGAHTLKEVPGYITVSRVEDHRRGVVVAGVEDIRGEHYDTPKHTTGKILQASSLKASRDLALHDGRYIKTSDGKLLKDLGHPVGTLLEVTGLGGKRLLVELSPEVAGLLNNLGLAGISEPIGAIVKTAGTVGDLLAGLAEPVEDLLCVLSDDLGALLIKLAPTLTRLLSRLGLSAVGGAVGRVVYIVGETV